MGGIFAEPMSHCAPGTAYDTDAEHGAAIRADGLRVMAGGDERTGRPEAVADPTELAGRRFDAADFLVKSGATSEALRPIRPVLPDGTALLTLQNGLGRAEDRRGGKEW